jgi:hypothetical protein
MNEFYEIKATNNMMNFKQQNAGAITNKNNQQLIDKIIVSLPSIETQQPYLSCALLQDHQTVVPLFLKEDTLLQ